MKLKNTLVAACIAAGSMTGIASMAQTNTFAATAKTEAKTETKSTGSTNKTTVKTETKTSAGSTTKTATKSDTKTQTKTDSNTQTKSADTSKKTTTTTKSSDTSKKTTTTTNTVKITIEGKTFDVPKTGYKWLQVNGQNYFVQNGKLVTGWKWFTKADGEKTNHWSYFDAKSGRLYTGWNYMDAGENEKTAHWSYFGDNGWLRTGWQNMGKGTSNPDGNAAQHWSYFGDNGWLRTGWQSMGKGTSNPDGNAAQHWSYFGSNGWLRTGWQKLGKGTSNPDGNNKAHWSYFGNNGWMVKGWYTNSDGLHYFKSNGWMCENETTKIDKSDYKFDGRGIISGVNHSDFKYVNQYRTYGYYPMSCGSSSSLMAMQAAGYCKWLDTKAEYEDYLSSWRAVCGSSFGTKNGVGASLPSKIVSVVKQENTTQGVPVKGLTGGSVSPEYLKDSLTHGQTSVVIIQNYKIYTHWIAITGWEMKNGELVFKIADPLPNDCGRGAASSATNVSQGNLGTSMKKSTLFSLMDAGIVKRYHGGRCATTFGNYKALKSYY